MQDTYPNYMQSKVHKKMILISVYGNPQHGSSHHVLPGVIILTQDWYANVNGRHSDQHEEVSAIKPQSARGPSGVCRYEGATTQLLST